MTTPERPSLLCAGKSPLFDSRFNQESVHDYRERMEACRYICTLCQHKRSCKFTAEQLTVAERTGVWCGVDVGTVQHRRGIDWSSAPPERPQDIY